MHQLINFTMKIKFTLKVLIMGLVIISLFCNVRAQLVNYGNVNILNEGACRIIVIGSITNNGSTLISNSNYISLTGSLTNNTGTVVNTGGGIVNFNGTIGQTISGPFALGNMTINDVGGVSLNNATSSSIIVNGTLNLSTGNLILGNNNITTVSISGGTSSSYVATTGTGLLTVGSVSSTTTLPIGPSTSDFTPLTVTPSTTTTLTAGVSSSIINPPCDQKEVNLQWTLLGNPSTTSTITYQWNGIDEINGFSRTSCDLGNWTTSYTAYHVTPSGSNPYTVTQAGLTLPSSGNNYYVIANTGDLLIPTITAEPTNKAICTGNSATFNVSASGAAPLSYNWISGGISVGSSSSYSTSIAGTYICVISNCLGSVSTTAATLTVNPNPTASISGTLSYCSGSSTMLTAIGNTTAPYTYYWNDASTSNPRTVSGAAQTYNVTITDDNLCSGSISATTTVNTCTCYPVNIASQSPASQTLCEGNPLTFTVTPAGTAPFSYQWKKNNANMTGKTNSSYIISSLLPGTSGDGGSYTCVVTNSCPSTANTTAVTLTVNPNANITLQPADASVAKNGSTSFKVTSNGAGMSYQWQFSPDGNTFTSITSAGSLPAYSNWTSATLGLGSVPLENNNYKYRCVVSSSCSRITSSVATLTVNNIGIAGLWDGGTSGDEQNWNNAANWDDGYIPLSTVNVLIPGSAEFQPVIGNGITGSCKTITINPGAGLDVNLGGSLTADGTTGNNITINPKGSITVDGTVTINGTMTLQANSTGTSGLLQGDNGQINGSVAIQRYISRVGYHYISSPFSTAKVDEINGFSPVNLKSSPSYYIPENPPSEAAMPNIWEIDEAHSHNILYDYNSWLAPGSSETMGTMKGYTINLASLPAQSVVSITKSGSDLNNGNKSINAFKASPSTDNTAPYYHSTNAIDEYGSTSGTPKAVRGIATNGWNLVGNPYASPVDWDAVCADQTNAGSLVSNSISYYQQTGPGRWSTAYNYGNYQPIIGSSGAVLSPPQTQYIPVMTSFMINNNYVNLDRSGIYLSNLDRKVTPEALGTYAYKKSSCKYPLIRLAAFMSDNIESRDESVVYFNQNATTEYNIKFDVPKLMNTDLLYPNIYSLASENRVASKGFPELKEDMVIPVGFSVNTEGKYTIKASDINNLPAGTHVYLIDTKRSISQDLTIAPSYSFSFDGTDDNRFFLKFAMKQSAISNQQSAKELCNIYSSENTLFVNYSNPDNEKVALSIYDITGQNLKEVSILSRFIGTQFSIHLDVAPGVYFVKVITTSKVYTQKVYIQ